MTTTVKIKRSETGSSVPGTSDLAVGEVALNTADQRIYVKDSGNNVKLIGSGADATTSIKGIASFSSSNFTVSSGAVSINADQSGTITGVGTITTGVWNGTAIGSQYGGTGQNFSSSTGVAYFDSGTASTVSMATKGQLLVGDGSGAPSALSVGTNDYVLTADSSTGTGVAWKAASGGGSGSAIKNMFFFTATTNQTTFTGSDDDSNTLSYSAGTGKTNIYLNGILLDDADYTASNGTSIVLSTAAANNDLLTVETFVVSETFEVSDDTSPQLGGNLDLNSNNITGTGNISTTGTLSLTNTTTDDSLLITTTEDSSTAAPVITLKRNSSSPADADYLGQLKFKGENDADQEVVYAKVTGKISDASDSSEDGLIEFTLKKAGSNNIGARLTSTALTLINGTGLSVDGDVTFTGDNYNVVWDKSDNSLEFGDNAKAVFGAGPDLSIYHDGSNSIIAETGTGGLAILSSIVSIENAAANETMATFTQNGAVSLRHDNTEKFVTTTDGVDITSTGSIKVPVGTTAQRNSSPANGDFRFNTTTSAFEGYDGSAWGSIGGGASAGGAIYENVDDISANYTITSGSNGFSVGPMTIASGVTVTVPSGQRWVIL